MNTRFFFLTLRSAASACVEMEVYDCVIAEKNEARLRITRRVVTEMAEKQNI